LDDRIVNQFALFSLMSSPTAALDEWLRGHPKLAHPVIIPASLKWEIRDKLDQANISERVLFPGLDGLCKLLKRYYSPRPSYTRSGKRRVRVAPTSLQFPDENDGASRTTARPGESTSPGSNGARRAGRRGRR
jgi:hypothetical protein